MKMNPVVHFEMGYSDDARVSKFYSEVFGWKMQHLGENMGNYIVAQSGKTDEKGILKETNIINGGFYKTEVKSESTTHVVISVDNLLDHIAKVKAAGGEITSEAMDIPGIGTYASFKDTEGNSVGMLQPVPMGK
jgi:uncharacterized protein